MAAEYEYYIENENNGYVFRLVPNNNRNQEIGRSEVFETYSDCQTTLELFQASSTQLCNEPELCEIIKDGNSFFFRIFYNDRKNIFYRVSKYSTKRSCCNGVQAVIKNIDASLSVRK